MSRLSGALGRAANQLDLNQAAVDELESIEWVIYGYDLKHDAPSCPWCGRFKWAGHADHCMWTDPALRRRVRRRHNAQFAAIKRRQAK